jgi:hypothetical protein
MALADDLPHAWHHPAATAETRKRILRAVFEEIGVRVEAGQGTLFGKMFCRDVASLTEECLACGRYYPCIIPQAEADTFVTPNKQQIWVEHDRLPDQLAQDHA